MGTGPAVAQCVLMVMVRSCASNGKLRSSNREKNSPSTRLMSCRSLPATVTWLGLGFQRVRVRVLVSLMSCRSLSAAVTLLSCVSIDRTLKKLIWFCVGGRVEIS